MDERSYTIIQCPSCGQRNRIKHAFLDSKPICQNCQSVLIEDSSRQDETPEHKKPPIIDPEVRRSFQNRNFQRQAANNVSPKNTFYIPMILLIGFGLFVVMFDGDTKSQTRKIESSTQKTRQSPQIDQHLVEKPLPFNGIHQCLTDKSLVAPFKINVGYGDHYFIKLVDQFTKEPCMYLFARSSSTVEIEVPLGSYELRYATGEKWYGLEHLFGSKTTYNKAEDVFQFKETAYQVSGYEVTLYRVSSGNMNTTRINASQF